uniref:Uncharacterized protein n=1 Tax=Anguilla anguilla TaxID=7936 RepID=A0A0E9Q1Z9_ANGAN
MIQQLGHFQYYLRSFKCYVYIFIFIHRQVFSVESTQSGLTDFELNQNCAFYCILFLGSF